MLGFYGVRLKLVSSHSLVVAASAEPAAAALQKMALNGRVPRDSAHRTCPVLTPTTHLPRPALVHLLSRPHALPEKRPHAPAMTN